MSWAMLECSHKPHETKWLATRDPYATCWTFWCKEFRLCDSEQAKKTNKFCGLSLQANYTD
jgi:hypothetical protein